MASVWCLKPDAVSEFRLVGLRDRNEPLIEMILIVLGADHFVERHFRFALVATVTLSRVPWHGECAGILDVNLDRLRAVDDLFHGRVITLASNSLNLEAVLRRADLLVGAVLIAGARAPVLVSKDMVASMKEGAVIVDVAVDQGGSVETIHPTTLLDPVYVVSGVVHYGVANMPALVPRTSTFALTNATLPYALALATQGVAEAARANPALARGINIWRGKVVHPAVAAALGETPTPLETVLR